MEARLAILMLRFFYMRSKMVSSDMRKSNGGENCHISYPASPSGTRRKNVHTYPEAECRVVKWDTNV